MRRADRERLQREIDRIRRAKIAEENIIYFCDGCGLTYTPRVPNQRYCTKSCGNQARHKAQKQAAG